MVITAAIWSPDSGKHAQGWQAYLLYPDSDALCERHATPSVREGAPYCLATIRNLRDYLG